MWSTGLCHHGFHVVDDAANAGARQADGFYAVEDAANAGARQNNGFHVVEDAANAGARQADGFHAVDDAANAGARQADGFHVVKGAANAGARQDNGFHAVQDAANARARQANPAREPHLIPPLCLVSSVRQHPPQQLHARTSLSSLPPSLRLPAPACPPRADREPVPSMPPLSPAHFMSAYLEHRERPQRDRLLLAAHAAQLRLAGGKAL
eukprot:131158-Chlamydomonas_euryale.AAC.7